VDEHEERRRKGPKIGEAQGINKGTPRGIKIRKDRGFQMYLSHNNRTGVIIKEERPTHAWLEAHIRNFGKYGYGFFFRWFDLGNGGLSFNEKWRNHFVYNCSMAFLELLGAGLICTAYEKSADVKCDSIFTT